MMEKSRELLSLMAELNPDDPVTKVFWTLKNIIAQEREEILIMRRLLFQLLADVFGKKEQKETDCIEMKPDEPQRKHPNAEDMNSAVPIKRARKQKEPKKITPVSLAV